MSFRNYYDSSSYGRSRDTGRGATRSSTDRPTAVKAKYINTTPSYKSSSIPILCTERSSLRDETPISTIANRYANYNKTEKPTTKYEKKDYSKLTVPLVSTNRSRDVSPVSTASKYSLTRSRHLSPDRRTTKSFKEKSRDPSPAERDKDIPSKTEKSSGYNSLSSYKLYPRTSTYTRPATRAEAKPEITVNRYGIANRLSSNYLRSPPTVKITSISPVSHHETTKCEIEKSVSPITVTKETSKSKQETYKENIENGLETTIDNIESKNETEVVNIVTRHTSPTPPGSSVYVRTRRADMAKTVEGTITRPKKRPEMVDKEIQSDRMDDTTRSNRFANTIRPSASNWSTYTPTVTNYTGYAGRYSTQYSNLRDNSYSDRSSRSRSTEPQPKENGNNSQSANKETDKGNPNNSEFNEDSVAVYEQSKDDDTSEIIINVNLKLKRAKSPLAVTSTELVSPEITITNCQLPPQAPKLDGSTKTKKIKIRKSSADSSSDSSIKKKVTKRRSKSVSSTDSDQGSETNDKVKESNSSSSTKSINRNSSSNNIQKSNAKLRHSKSRESNSPDSSSTLSTQSSVSEDDTVSKSKTNDTSRTSADESSIQMDRSGKQQALLLQKTEGGNEEAKSFLIRALAPVTNLFKIRHQDSSDNTCWLDSSTSESTSKDVSNFITESEKSKSKSNTDNIIASNDDNLVQLKAIRHIESGERAWWLDSDPSKSNTHPNVDNQKSSSDKNMPRKIRHIESGERAWWLEPNSDDKYEVKTPQTNISESSDPNRQIKKCKFVEEEKPWWLDSSANIPEGVERLSPPRKSSSDSEKGEKYNFFKVRRIDSGDQNDWWLTSNENSLSGHRSESQNNLSKSGSDQRSFPLIRIRHIESGERPWWLSGGKSIPEGIEKLPSSPPSQESDSSDSEEVQVYIPPPQIPPFPLHLPDDEPLGDRRSPEGLETPKENEDYRGRSSPYENNHSRIRRKGSGNLAYQKGAKKYISRYSDIDDILGTSGQIYSPFMDSILARKTGQVPFDHDECEEINPTQVRIHDSTAQRPIIKKLLCRSEIIDYRDEDQSN